LIASFPPSFVSMPAATSTNCASSLTCRTNSNPSSGRSRFTLVCGSGAPGASGPPVVAESAHGSGPVACAAEVCALSPSVGPSPSSDPAPNTGAVPFARPRCPCALPRREGPPSTTISPNSEPCLERIPKVETPTLSDFAITSSAAAPTRTADLRTNAPWLAPTLRRSMPLTWPQRSRRHGAGRRQTLAEPCAHRESKPAADPRWDKMLGTFSFGVRWLATAFHNEKHTRRTDPDCTTLPSTCLCVGRSSAKRKSPGSPPGLRYTFLRPQVYHIVNCCQENISVFHNLFFRRPVPS